MSNFYGTWTLLKKENKRFLKVWMQTILAPVISNLLFFAVFGLSLHRAIVEINGVGYLQFLVPGLIMMGISNSAFQNPSSSIIIMKYQGLIGDLMTIPLKSFELLIAYITSAVFRGLLIGFITYLSSIYFIDFTYQSIPIIFVSAVLISLFFSFLGLFIGIWANEFDKSAFVSNFVLTPLTFFGGVFYSIKSLPEPFNTISSYNPIFHMINLLRYGLTGASEFPISISLWGTLAVTIFIGGVSYLALRCGWHLQN